MMGEVVGGTSLLKLFGPKLVPKGNALGESRDHRYLRFKSILARTNTSANRSCLSSGTLARFATSNSIEVDSAQVRVCKSVNETSNPLVNRKMFDTGALLLF
jgi:hypothetical protein